MKKATVLCGLAVMGSAYTLCADDNVHPASRPAPSVESTAAGAVSLASRVGRDRLTGSWNGARPWLEDRGISLDLGLTTIYQQNVHGGVRTSRAHAVSGSYDLELTIDSAALGLWDGGTLYALAEGSWDDGISARGYVGDRLGVNGDAAGDRAIDVTELWFEQSLFDGRLRVRMGKLDLTVDFETNAYANDETKQFLNQGLVNAANVPFPDNGQGVQFILQPSDGFYLAAGVADADADARETGFRTAYHGPADFFSVYEFGVMPRWKTAHGSLPGTYRFGLWFDPRPKEKFFNDFGGRRYTWPTKRDDIGFYVSMDQKIYHEHPDQPDDEQGLGIFLRYSFAHGDVNEIEHFWSVGWQYQGLIPKRDYDVLAFGAAQAILSEQLRKTGARPHRETVLEVYYQLELTPWLTLTPDLQWILRPGGEQGADAFVVGLRLQVAF